MIYSSLLRIGVICIPGYAVALDVTKTDNPVEGRYIVKLLPDAMTGNDGEIGASSVEDKVLQIITGGKPDRGGKYGATSHNEVQVFEKVYGGFSANLNSVEKQNVLDNPYVVEVVQDGYVQLEQQVTWGLDRIDDENLPLDNNYNPTFGNDGAGVTAYIIDTGIRASHNEFENRATQEFNSAGSPDEDCNGHGTHVAGTVGSKNYGVAKQVKLVGVKVLSCSGSGTWSGVIAGINWVAANAKKPATANLSLGGGKNSAINTAIKNLHDSGVTTVVAAGNSNANACSYSPASEPTAITVGSTTNTDARSSFSNWGTCVDIFAPGSSITAPWINSDTALRTISGTSMASPHVCGGAALYLSQYPDITPEEVIEKMIEDSIADTITNVGNGSPNQFLYVGGSQNPTVSPAPTKTKTNAPTEAPTLAPPENIAKGKPTAQSSNYSTRMGLSKNGVDGNTNASWGGNSVTHTRTENKPWWTVDLQDNFAIDVVKVYNRQDCCSERLNNFDLFIIKNGKVEWTYNHQGKAEKITVITVPGNVMGDKIKVQLRGSRYPLSLAEVEVFAKPTKVKKCSTNGKKCLEVEKENFNQAGGDDVLKVKFDFRPMRKWQKDTKQVVIVKGGAKPSQGNTYGTKNVRRRKQTLFFDLATLLEKVPGGSGPLDIYFVKEDGVIYPETKITINVS